MERLTLLHLTFVGPSVSPATVEFGPRLTLVRGPSDTGKSYIADTIDFMLGASKLEYIPERDGYDTALLGIGLSSGESITLARALQGGGFRLLRGDHRAHPLPAAAESLSAKHGTEKSLSRYLLGKIGLDGKVIRKDGVGKTISLSLRKLVRLVVIGETDIQSRTPPIFTGQHPDRTAELSTFRLLLQGEDDSAVQPGESAKEQRTSKAAKNDVIDILLAELRGQLRTDETLQQIGERGQRLQDTITESTGAIEQTAAVRQQWGHNLSNSERLVAAARRSLADLDALDARFALLYQQYTSDLDRLEAVAEAGTLLGYFTPGPCAFCGADPEHQHPNDDSIDDDADDVTALAESVSEEQRKTTALREDLLQAIAGVRADRAEKAERLVIYTAQAAQARSEIARLDSVLNPQQLQLRNLLTSSSQLERDGDTIRRIQRLEALRNEIENAPRPDAIAPTAGLHRDTVDDLSRMIAARLRTWGFHDADNTSYSFDTQDVISANQLRSAHGKGVRAILHAAFTISLAQYCFDHSLPHPGFVVLDSPLVVYRPPDPNAAPETSDDILDTTTLAGRFYADVQANFSGQIIVLENENPPEALNEAAIDIRFTKNPAQGRYGLFV
ncbi:hypothetical protein [Actinophytocola sediminis]